MRNSEWYFICKLARNANMIFSIVKLFGVDINPIHTKWMRIVYELECESGLWVYDRHGTQVENKNVRMILWAIAHSKIAAIYFPLSLSYALIWSWNPFLFTIFIFIAIVVLLYIIIFYYGKWRIIYLFLHATTLFLTLTKVLFNMLLAPFPSKFCHL